MKKLLIISVLTITLFSCKKDNTPSASSNGTELQSKVSFTLGDTAYTINGSLTDSAFHGSIFTIYNNDTATGSVYYYELEVKYSGVELWLSIPTTTLTATTYNEPVPSGDAFNEHPSFLNLSNGNNSIYGIAGTQYYGTQDFVNLTIQSIHDGSYADGIFTAHVVGSVDASITNGTFKNVKILY